MDPESSKGKEIVDDKLQNLQVLIDNRCLQDELQREFYSTGNVHSDIYETRQLCNNEVLGDEIVQDYENHQNEVPDHAAEVEHCEGVESFSPGGTMYWTPNFPDYLKPNTQIRYSSLKAVMEMYYLYALEGGFDVRQTTVRKDGNIVTLRYLVCNKEGAPNTSVVDTLDNSKCKTKRRADIHRIGCKACIRFRIVPRTKTYEIYEFREKHNHRLISKQNMHLSRTSRQLKFLQKSVIYKMSNQNVGATKSHRYMTGISGGYNYTSGLTSDYKNFWRDLNCFIGGSDAQMLVDKMEGRKEHVPHFSFEYKTEDNKLNALFWADETSKLHYREFGDVVSFDATYSTNRYDLVFVPFTGIDNHKRCVTFGAGLISRENADSYIWLLNAFLNAFGKQPIIVLSDQDPAMKKAISCVLPQSYHRLCMWHITSKLPLKICPSTMNNSDFKFRFHSLVWNLKIDVNQFEEEWAILLKDYGLSDDKWLNDMYDCMYSWIPAYFKDVPMSGLMRTTSRSESQNFSFQQSIQKGSMLVNFMTSFESCMEKQRFEQSVLDFNTNQKSPQMKTVLPIEVNAARHYTREVFVQVQNEIFHSLMSCTITSMVNEGDIDSFVIREKKGRREVFISEDNDIDCHWDILLKEAQFKVCFNKLDKTFKCSCMLYDHIGMLCRHIFSVFKYYDYDDIPSRYILRRWRRDIIPTDMLRRCFRYGDNSQNIDQVALEVFAVVDNCVSTLSYDKKKLECYLQQLKDLKIRIDDEHSNEEIINKKAGFEKLLGVSTPRVIDIQNPGVIKNKGCGTRKRMKSIKEVVIEKVANDPRTCTWCWKYVYHDARNCPDRKKGIPRAVKPKGC